MCEWLSHGEWCDVKLLCGGHAFSAHRAVLASVSNFLRQTLLSCPNDEWPTIIVLPDFDLEAMSSVLYYIYNGEVIIQKRKLEMFLEIVKALEIFIDHQYLPKLSEITDDNYEDFKRFSETYVPKNSNIFKLEFGNCKDQLYINIKKGQDIQTILLQYSHSHSDINDKLYKNWRDGRRSRLRNLKSPYGDRQRNSFLRDLFIETYPPNGNVNGLSTSVLAISNECYRAPASVLLTNANGKHLSAGDALLEQFKNITGQISDLTSQYLSGKQCAQRDKQNCILNYVKSDSSSSNSSELAQMDILGGSLETKSDKKTVRTNNIPKPTIPLRPAVQYEQFLSKIPIPSLDLSSMQSTSHEMLSNNRSLNSFNEEFKKQYNLDENLCSNTTKATILNQVLDNPWCPRIPVNCKPFRRKMQNPTNLGQKECKNRVDTVNDSNNNNEKSTPLIIDTNIQSVCREETKDLIDTSISSDTSKENFKCSICNQVLTSSESLAVHTRRHSSSARYTCGECGKTFSQLRNFKYHMSVHRGTREFAATCTVCGKYFNDRGYLSSHMKIHRNRKEYKCTLCPKSFNQRVAYNMHVRIHTGVKPHSCSECGKAFSRKMLLKQHQRTHSGERPYACPHCDKRFADRSNMTLHLRLHTGVKPFSCSLCPKSFTKKHHLKSHLNFHTGSKPYSCPRCKLAFTQSSNMRTHMKKCTAPPPGPHLPDTEHTKQSHL